MGIQESVQTQIEQVRVLNECLEGMLIQVRGQHPQQPDSVKGPQSIRGGILGDLEVLASQITNAQVKIKELAENIINPAMLKAEMNRPSQGLNSGRFS